MNRRRMGRLALAGSGRIAFGGRAHTQTVATDELHVITRYTPYGTDPVHEFSSGEMRTFGAAEGLLRISPYGDVEAELARSYEMVDPVTWTVYPMPGLPLNLANEWLVIHNAASFGPQDNAFDLGAADLTGFYRITSFDPRIQVRLAQNPRHWGPPPRMSRLRVDEINDVDARSLAALSGEAHIVRQVSTQVSGQLERSRTMRLVTIPGIGTFSAYLNIQRPPFDDVLVRRALAWAVDREELVLQAIDGWGKGAPSWLAPNPFYPEAARVGYPKHDLAKAGQLLDEAGWRIAPGGRARAKNGVPLRFRVLWFGSNRPAAEVLQAQWSRLGAEVTVEGSTQYSFLQQKRAQNDWEILLESWGTLGDPAAVLARHLAPDGDLNYGRFSDPTTDALLAGFAGLYSPEERRLQALRVNERQAELVPFIPLYSSQGLTAVARTVRNFVVQPISQQQEVHPDLWVAA